MAVTANIPIIVFNLPTIGSIGSLSLISMIKIVNIMDRGIVND